MVRNGLIQFRNGTASEWALENPVLAVGEPGLEIDTGLLKFGDGVTRYLDLPYFTGTPKPPQAIQGPITHTETRPADGTVRTAITAPSVTHTKGNLILVYVAVFTQSGTISVSDSMGNTYTAAGPQAALPGVSVTGVWFWAYAKATGANIVTASINGQYSSIRVFEFSGITAEAPIDVIASSAGATSAAFSTAYDRELVLAAWHTEGSGAPTAKAGYTLLDGDFSADSYVSRPVEMRITSNKLTGEQVTLSRGTGTVYGSWVLTVKQNNSIEFVTTGQTFSPRIKVSGSPSIKWTFSDGTESTSTAPSKDFGTAVTRTQRLEVSPWSALEQINIGYDGSDGGSTPGAIFDSLPQQNVTEIKGLRSVAPYLKHFAASHNPLTSLDLRDFTCLTTVECYYCTSLADVKLQKNYRLSRLCLERAALSSLDLSDCFKLADLRGALQAGNPFVVNWGYIGQETFHICIRDEPNMQNNIVYSHFPVLRELYIWNNGWSGNLVISSPEMGDLRAADNKYTSVDISACSKIYRVELQNNPLTQAAVDSIYEFLDSFGTSNGNVNTSGTSAPSASGLTHITNLRSRGWTVTHD